MCGMTQALELNDDGKPEQLIAFLDDICSLRYAFHYHAHDYSYGAALQYSG